MTKFAPIPVFEQQAFTDLLSRTKYDARDFRLELTEHSAATYGPRVRTIQIFWQNRVIAIYGAADCTSWIEQFRADFNTGLVTQVLEDHLSEI